MTAATSGTIVLNTLDDESDRRLVVERRIQASAAMLFEACTDPARLSEWWGPPGFTTPVYEIDLRPGGAMYYAMTGPDGLTYGMTGEVKDISRPDRLVIETSALTPKGEVALVTKTAFDFRPVAGATNVTARHLVLTATETGSSYLAAMPGAWLEKLDRLAAYAEANGGVELVVTRHIRAPRALVFEAWTQPAHLERWFAPNDMSVTGVEVDARPGGRFRFCHRHPDWKEPFWVTCEYVTVEPPSRLIYRQSFSDEEGNAAHKPGFAIESAIDVTFEERDGGTQITVRHTGLAKEQGERQGWTEMLDRLVVMLEGE
jgi:uncharacterized protein YndB with AHSA1/START domain